MTRRFQHGLQGALCSHRRHLHKSENNVSARIVVRTFVVVVYVCFDSADGSAEGNVPKWDEESVFILVSAQDRNGLTRLPRVRPAVSVLYVKKRSTGTSQDCHTRLTR